MGRRIFEEKKYNLLGRILPLRETEYEIPDFRKAGLIRKAETALAEEIPILLASDYMLFCKSGF